MQPCVFIKIPLYTHMNKKHPNILQIINVPPRNMNLSRDYKDL